MKKKLLLAPLMAALVACVVLLSGCGGPSVEELITNDLTSQFDEIKNGGDDFLAGLEEASGDEFEQLGIDPKEYAKSYLEGFDYKIGDVTVDEDKDHGADKGNLLGYEPQDGDRVVMVEDVTTSGKSIDETYPKVKAAADVEIKGLIVSLNRMEVGKGGVTTAQKEIEAKYGFPVASIVSMAEVVETLYNHEIDGKVVIDDELKAAIDAYYEQYGARE